MAFSTIPTIIDTLGDALEAMAPFAGGSVPADTSTEWDEWVRWIQMKQEEYAKRGFWRACLTREELALVEDDETVLLPERFHKSNGLYMFIVDDVDWNDYPNSSEQTIFVETVNDATSSDFKRWRARFGTAVTATDEDNGAVVWYFSIPPTPNAVADKLLLPGDMIVYGALSEYFRQANQEGSQDDARNEAENRFQEYLGIDVIPDKSDLLTNRENPVTRKDYLTTARAYYSSRVGRNTQT